MPIKLLEASRTIVDFLSIPCAICYAAANRLNMAGNIVFGICLLAILAAVAIIYTKIDSGLKFPKSVKRRLPQKPLRRRRHFRPHDNPTKKYRPPHPDMVARAEARRLVQLAAEWPAEMAVKGILHIMGEKFEHQVIIYYPGGFLIADFFDHKRKVRIEVDGPDHQRDLPEYDPERDKWLLRNMGIKTLRISNATAQRNPHACHSIIRAWLDS